MKVETLCQCRGTGKCYIAIKTEQPLNNVTLVSTSAKGNQLPTNLVRLSDHEFVLVLADFSIEQFVSLHEQDNTKEAIFKTTIHPRRFSLVSKINGRLHADYCERIRNIDISGKYCPNKITCELISFTPHGQILVGQVSGLAQSDCTSLVVLNDKGDIIGKPETTLFSLNESYENTHDFEIKMYRTEEDHGLVVAALNQRGEYTGGFTCLKEKPMRELIDASTKYFMTAFEDPEYTDWIGVRRLNEAQAEEQRNECQSITTGPLFSVIVPLYNTPLALFDEMLDSVLSQSYPFWELLLINSTPENRELSEHVTRRMCEDERIILVTLDGNYGITENTNRGIEKATGDYLCFFDHDDVIEPNLLLEYYEEIEDDPSTTMLYCDEDKILGNHLINPSFKPDFNIDLLRSNNYLCHMLCVSRQAYERVDPQDSSLDGAQDHALTLKIAELGGVIKHIPKVLYHWRITPNSTAGSSDTKPYASEAGIRAVKQHLERVGIDAEVGLDHLRPFRYRIYYRIPDATRASIIIPIMQGSKQLTHCLERIAAHTDFDNFEILLVGDHDILNTNDHEHSIPNVAIRMIKATGTTSLADYINLGAEAATGDVLAVIQEGYLPLEEQWLTELTGIAIRDDTGVAGTMTCSHNGLIRQAGLTFTHANIVPLSRNLGFGERGYIYNPLSVRDVSLLECDCFAISRAVFERYGGFNEAYATHYAVYDFCLKTMVDGLWNVYTPAARVAPIEATEGAKECHDTSRDSELDRIRLFADWRNLIDKHDPFFNRNFSSDPHFAETYKLNKPILK